MPGLPTDIELLAYIETTGGPEIRHGDERLVDTVLAAAIDHLRSIDVDLELDPFPDALRLAILMLAYHWYYVPGLVQQEERRSMVPYGVTRLIAPYRRLSI